MSIVRKLCLLVLAFAVVPALADGVKLPAAERVVLDNGTVLILNEKHDVPLVGLQAVVRGGAIADPAGKYGVASLLADMLSKGAGDRNAAEFAEAAAAVGGNIAASADLESISVAADFLSKDADLMVELVADMLLRPTLARDEFEKLRDRSVNLIKAAKGSDPGNLMPAYAAAFLFGDHPYGNPVSGSEASLANLRHADLSSYYEDVMGGDRLVIAVSGDFDAAEMRAALTESFGNWRAAGAELADIEAPVPAETRRVYLIDKPGATQSYFYVGNVGVSRGFAQRAEVDLANTVFGGRFTSMLVTELRTKSGLSYSAGSSLRRYRQPGSLFITSFTQTEKTVAALDVALATLAKLRETGLDEGLLASSRNYILGQFPPRLETAAQMAATFAMIEAEGLGAAYIDNYGAALAAATTESVATVIDSVYPAADRLVFVVLGDAEVIREPLANYGPVTEISISEPRFHPAAP